MNTLYLRWGIAAGASAAFFVLPTASAGAAEGETEVTVIHANDIHSSIEDMGKLAGYIDEKKAESDHVVFVSPGDIFSGDPVVDLQDGAPMVDLMNDVGLETMTIGNHEFDYGQEAFAQNEADSDFTWLSANTSIEDSSIPIEEPAAYDEINVNGIDIALLGMTQAPPATAPDGIDGLSFDNDYAGVAESYESLGEDADLFLGLTHIGYSEDEQLAEDVEFFDAIIGGHTHTVLEEPAVVNGTPIAQAGSSLDFIGEMTFTLDDETGEVTNTEGQLHDIESIEAMNEDVQAKADDYIAEADELLGEVIGETNTGLARDSRYEEDAPLGNFWTDSMRYTTDTDVAVYNNGGLRAGIDPGDITARDIYSIEPFGNNIVEMNMTGEALENVIEQSYNRSEQVDLQTSGLNYTIYTTEDGAFNGADLTIDGEPVESTETYSVALPNFLADGGDGYNFEGEIIQPDAGLVTNSMITYAEFLMDTEGAVDYETQGRINLEVGEPAVEEPEAPVENVTKECIIDEVHELVPNGNPNKNDSGFNRGQLISVLQKYKNGKEVKVPAAAEPAKECIDQAQAE